MREVFCKEIYDLKSQNKAVMTAITTQGLLAEFATLSGKVGDTDLALEKLSNAYDRSHGSSNENGAAK